MAHILPYSRRSVSFVPEPHTRTYISPNPRVRWPVINFMKQTTVMALALALSQTACVAGGYSSEGGFYLWPGSLVITALLVLLFLYMRRRR